MSTQINDGEPAFPVTINDDLRTDCATTLRDYFAAHETLSDLGSPDAGSPDYIAIPLTGPQPPGDWRTNAVEWLKWESLFRAKLKYIRADAMLKAREVKL